MIAAIWSLVWLEWWALLPVGAVALWLSIDPFVFAPVEPSRSWASKGIYGEQLWLSERDRVYGSHRTVLRSLIGVGLIKFVLLAWGLWRLLMWPTVYGATLVMLAQLWRIDRMGLLYGENWPQPCSTSATDASVGKTVSSWQTA